MALRSPSKEVLHLLEVVVAAVVICALYFAKVVFVPLALAMLFAFALSPTVKLVERLRLGRAPSTIFVVILTLAGVGAIGWVVATQFAGVVNQLPQYQSNIKEKIDSLHFSNNPTVKNATITVNQLSNTLASRPDAQSDESTSKRSPNTAVRPTQPLPVEVIKPPSLPLESVQSIIRLLLQTLIVIVFTIFMLLQRENLRNRFISLAGHEPLTSMTQALDEAAERVGHYLGTQLAVNTGYGAFIGVGLHFIGIPGGLLWGVVVGIVRFLPYVGPPLGGIMPLLLALAVFHGWERPLITLGLFVTTELVVAHFIEPMLYGSHTGVSPLAILVAAIFWAFLWGPIGLVLSTPLTVCLVVLGRHIPHLAFLTLLLGDEPVLPPDLRVYQRLLAMDREEAEHVLESLLREKTLAEVYDSVLIPAIHLAEQDRLRNRLDEDSEKVICQNVRDIIDDLNETDEESENRETYPSTEGPSRASNVNPIVNRTYSILCVSARDEADEIVGIMLAQLLERAGHNAHYVRPATITDVIEQIRLEKPDVVCISALPPFVISHARSLYKALKKQSLELELVVGLWNFTGDVGNVAQRMGLPDSFIATTLSGMVRKINELHSVDTTDVKQIR